MAPNTASAYLVSVVVMVNSLSFSENPVSVMFLRRFTPGSFGSGNVAFSPASLMTTKDITGLFYNMGLFFVKNLYQNQTRMVFFSF